MSAVRSESPGLGIAFNIGGCNLIRFSDTDPLVNVVDLAVVPEVFEASVDLLDGKLVRFFIVFSLSLVVCNQYALGVILGDTLGLVSRSLASIARQRAASARRRQDGRRPSILITCAGFVTMVRQTITLRR